MKLFCPDCGAAIPAANVDLATSTAKCSACDSVFAFDASAAEQRAPAGRPPGQRPLLPRPAGLNVEEFGGVWTVTYRWFTPALLFLAFFCVAWDSFLVFWYSIAIKHHGPWLMVVFPVVHVAVGVGLTYTTLAGFLNTTRVAVDGQSIGIRHGPVPWVGNLSLISSEIQQLFCERTFSRGNVNGNTNTTTTFALSAVMRGGAKLKLLRGFTEPDRPLFLEQEIERRLNIRPAAVVGEYHG